MITTKSDDKIKMAIELYELQEARRALEKREEELKEYFKNLIANDNGMNAGPILLMLEDCERRYLDRKSLEADVGFDVVKRHEKVTHFKKFNIKRAG